VTVESQYENGLFRCSVGRHWVSYAEARQASDGSLYCPMHGRKLRSKPVAQSRGTSRKPRRRRDFGDLLRRCWCPTCGVSLEIQEVEGKKTLVCPEHGEMNAYLSKNPVEGC
jgi:hypothetical protein